MKKITLFFCAIALSLSAYAQEIVLTQTSGAIGADGVACGDSGAGTTGDNYYMRYYDLGAAGITGNVALTGIEFNVGSSTGETELQVIVYQYDGFPSGFDVTNLPTPLATGFITVDPSMVGTRVRADFDVPAVANETSKIVATVFEEDGQSASFYMGTAAEETQTSYLASVACQLNEPTPVADVGFPEAKHIIDLVVNETLAVGDNLAEMVSVYPNPTSDILNINLPSSVEVKTSSLVDMLGRTANVALSNGQMNLSGLSAGVYFLQLDTNLGSYTQKIVKQ